MITFGLEEDQQLIVETVRKFAADSLRPQLREFEKEGVPASLRKQFDELGLGLIDMPEAVGGQGMSLLSALLVHEELSFGDPGAAVALWAPGAAAQAIFSLGSDEQQKKFLAPFANGGATGAVAYCEKAGPIEGFSVTAQKSGGGYVLNGKKAFVVNGGSADLVVVFAQLDGGPAAFVVEKGTAGLEPGARHVLLGLEAVAAHEVEFKNCTVPEANRLLGGDEFVKNTNRFLTRQGLIQAARQIGLANAAYEFALNYTQERKAFGKVIAHFQAIAFNLSDMHTETEGARWLLWKAAQEFEKGNSLFAFEAIAHANAVAWRVADDGVQLLGGAGFVKDYPSEKWMRDTKTLALFAPPAEAASLEVAALELGHPIGSSLPSATIQPFFL